LIHFYKRQQEREVGVLQEVRVKHTCASASDQPVAL